MKTRISCMLLFVVLVALLGEYALPSTATRAAGIGPNILVVESSSDVGGEKTNVAQGQLVRDIYHAMLSLPEQPTHKVCAMYVTAEYHLTFLHDGSSLLKANVQQGGCMTVLLGQGDVRASDNAFLNLLKKTHALTTRPTPKTPFGLGPNDLQSAYKLPSATAGKKQTIAIIDANDDPNAEADMNVYRAAFALPACKTSNGCFSKVNEHGGKNYPSADQGWAGEIALDLDMASAICPNCNIMLVEADSASFDDLGSAVNSAIRLGAKIVSNSYGAPEDADTARAYAHYYDHPGTIITVSAGDSGYGVQLPAAFKNVISVGGTSLSRASNTRGWTERVWSGTGSGCSNHVGKPAWQKDKGCGKRTVSDVAAVADPATGVAIYNTYGGNGWGVYGGTSAASPIIAGVYALAGNATKVDSSYLYSHAANLNIVTDGNNGVCSPDYLCTAKLGGYSGPTGLGTPNGLGAF